ncbi:MAG: hypothetical protein MUE90_08775 [Thermoanaerobaculales bacterium]|jgi:hypothetical protein|nr:hypothetical protein [Thermoanaerobaculales bacterium]
MDIRRVFAASCVLVLAAASASADLKLVKQQHTGAFTVMGRETPASDEEQTSWIGSDRSRIDSGERSTIVRLDANKLYIVNHADKTFHTLELPVEIEKFMPPGMADQIKAMMTFVVTVTPTEESKTIGDWTARRYDIVMTSQMVTTSMTMWATKDVAFDQKSFHRLYEHLNSLNPGMAAVAAEMRKIDGLVVEQESSSSMPMMGDAKITRSERTLSATELEPPPGTYEVPAGYSEQPFDFMASMQRQ